MEGTFGTSAFTTQMAKVTSHEDQMVVDLLHEVENKVVEDIPLQAKEIEALEMAMAKVPVNIHSKWKSHRSSQHKLLQFQVSRETTNNTTLTKLAKIPGMLMISNQVNEPTTESFQTRKTFLSCKSK
jgi:hypothetical protein